MTPPSPEKYQVSRDNTLKNKDNVEENPILAPPCRRPRKGVDTWVLRTRELVEYRVGLGSRVERHQVGCGGGRARVVRERTRVSPQRTDGRTGRRYLVVETLGYGRDGKFPDVGVCRSLQSWGRSPRPGRFQQKKSGSHDKAKKDCSKIREKIVSNY